MQLREKLRILADAAKYDASCSSSGGKKRDSVQSKGIGSNEGTGICHSYTPDGRCVSLLKILLTNQCLYDCAFCINRRSSNVPRAKFTVEELVQLTLDFYKRNYIEGLFLSSGIVKSHDETMEEMTRVAKSLREDHKFAGYIHLKLIAGASPELIAEAGRYADRVSVNVELPREDTLQSLAPEKRGDIIRKSMATFPVDVNTAERELLLRVPGLGVKSIDKIIAARRHRTLGLEDIARLTRSLDKCRPFLIARDWRPALSLTDDANLRAKLAPAAQQLDLFG